MVEQDHPHPNVHAPWRQWSADATLHVAAAYSNPYRWRARRRLFDDFRRHMASFPNVRLYVAEVTYGDRPHEVTSPDNPRDVQLRTDSELFHKENLINLAVQRFDPGWQYGAYCDGDFTLTRQDWPLEAVHQLQHHEWVQLFSQYADLSGGTLGHAHRQLGLNNSFAYNYVNNGYRLPPGWDSGGVPAPYYDGRRGGVGATGGAWAFRRAAFDKVGGLLDVCILGHGDWFMAFGLVGEMAPDMHSAGYTQSYMAHIRAWQHRAQRCNRNVGYVDQYATHHFHGPKAKRAYSSRDEILVRHQFDPVADLQRNWQGVWELTPDKPAMRDDIRRHLLSRNEDEPHVPEERR